MRTIFGFILSATLLTFCGIGDDEEDDTPPPVNSEPTPPQQVAAPGAPPGQVMVSVVANSTPPGAMVTGGGRALGVTPLQTQVPIPAPQPGQPPQTFAFTFQAAGYQTATVNATPMNNTITITAALAPAVAPTPVGAVGVGADPAGGDGPSIRVNGRGGGPIYDHNTTTGAAVVEQSCIIDRLRVRLRGRHSYYGDLHISLRSPSGRRYSLASGGSANPFRTHTVRRASGQQARGRWTLSIADRLAQDSGVLNGWNMEMTCR